MSFTKAQLIGDPIILPLFFINGILYNEYEIRKLQLRVAQGLVEDWEKIRIDESKDGDFHSVKIRRDGSLTGHLQGFSLSVMLTMDLLIARNSI